MLNPELRNVYTPDIIEQMVPLAAKIEAEGKSAIVCGVSNYKNLIKCPTIVYYKGDRDEILEDVQNIMFNLVTDEMAKADDYKWPTVISMSYHTHEDGV